MGRWHTDAVRKLGGKIAAVIDRDENAAYALAVQHNAAHYTSFGAALLDFSDIGAQKNGVIHICTPLHTHVELVTGALDAGWHVICEKPLADTAQETASLYKTAATMGRLLIPVHQFPFQDGALKAQKWIAAGRIGEIVGMEARFYSAGADYGDMSPDHIVNDILPHPLSLIHAIVGTHGGAPAASNLKSAFSETHLSPVPEHKAGTNLYWSLDYVERPNIGELRAFIRANATPITITISMNARPTLAEFTILGAKGTIHLDLYHGYAVLERGQVSRLRKILHPFDLSLHIFTSAGINLIRRAARREPAYPGLRMLIQSAYETIHMERSTPISPSQAIFIAYMRDRIMRRDSQGE
jgi:predicted dehydrogenase